MGIPKFKKNITTTFDCKNNIATLKKNQKYEVLVDFNSFIHIAQNKYLDTVYGELRNKIIKEEKTDQYISEINKNILGNITEKTIELYNGYVNNIKKQIGNNINITVFIDGIPPFAKIVEQINRTFMDKIDKLYEENVISKMNLNEHKLNNYIEAKKRIAEVLISPGEDIIKKIIVKLYPFH